MKTVSLFIIALFVVLLLRCPAFCSTPRHPGVTGVGDNPQEGMVSTKQTEAQSIQELIQNAKGNLAIEKKWELDPLSRPKFNLIPASDIGKYRYTDRYLFDLDDAEISHYFILQEDYVFRNLNGRFDKIPAGFIWDGASIPKVWGAIGLEVGNTRYNSAIAEGLIHDYMYRNPQRYSKNEADELFNDNLRRCNNPNPQAMYEAVNLLGDDAWQKHWNNQRQGYYDVFTQDFYAENLNTFNNARESSFKSSDTRTGLRDMGKIDTESIKSKSNDVRDDSDFDVCKCENPDNKDFQCQKCGKMSSWLAPHRDKEFEQMLRRGIK